MNNNSSSFITKIREYSIPLIAGVVVALFWANLDYQSYDALVHYKLIGKIDFHFLVNDIFMVLFFGLAAVEITTSVLPGGSLNPARKAIASIWATLGGVLGPIVVFLVLNEAIGAPEFARGWAVPTATDIALAWLLARLIFGAKHPAVSFLLLLAIIDDAIGLGIIAIFYPDPFHPVQPIWLVVTLAGMGAAYALRKRKVKSYWPYLICGGLLSWIGLYNAYLHPALALIFIIPFMPHFAKADNTAGHVQGHGHSTLLDFEHGWKTFIDFGLFAFGLANAGVAFATISNATWVIFLSLVVGKTFGIFTMGYIAQRLGYPLPDGMNNKHLAVAGLIAGLGLTVALFIAGVAFTDPAIQGAAKMGALFSGVVFILAPLLAKLLGIKKLEEAKKAHGQH